MAPPHEDPALHPIGFCRNCSAPLASDQRYCIACGLRRGPIPPAMRNLIAGGIDFPVSAEVEAAADERGFALPAPRSAAVAVTALLAFGVVIGSVVSPPAESAGNAPIVVAVSKPAPAPAAVAPAAPADTPSTDAAPVDTSVPPTQTIYVQAPDQQQPAPVQGPAPPAPLPVPPLPALPAIDHVFVVMLSGHGYDSAFGPDSQASYLSKTLTQQGELLPNYYAVAKGELANGVALLSGQGPNPDTTANCPQYSDVTPGTPDAGGQAQGTGCVYPAATKTLADQLFALGLPWKAYVQDMAAGGTGSAQTCRHPDAGGADPYQQPRPGDPYVTWRNPFVYFHSLLDAPASTCNTGDVDLSQLSTDLQQVGDTPAVSFIVPSRCHDGSDQPCAPDQPAGLAAADSFLQTVIPEIQNSPAYKQGGLIAITFDQAPQEGPNADSSSCCDTPAYPNMPAGGDPGQPAAQPGGDATGTQPAPADAAPPADPGAVAPADPTTTPPAAPTASASVHAKPADTTTTPAGTPATPAGSEAVKPTGGGGRVGMLLLSNYVLPKTVNTTGYFNHFSLLRSIEDLFAVDHLGYAATPTLGAFDKSVYSAYNTDG